MKLKLVLITAVISLTSFHQKEKTWTALGDSITYLNDHVDETKHRVTKGYMTRVVGKVPNIHYINQGHNGWTAIGIAKEIENLDLRKSDIYTVFLGTNDWWSGLPIGTLKDYKSNKGTGTVFGAYRLIINKLRMLNPGAEIILITPMQRADFVYIADANNNAWGSYKEKSGQMLYEFADAIKIIGKEEHLKVIDLFNNKKLRLSSLVNFKRLKDPNSGMYRNFKYPEFTGVDFHPDKDEYPYPVEAMNLTYDGLHPSDKGYEIIAKEILKLLKY